jgi:hypothetical protein
VLRMKNVNNQLWKSDVPSETPNLARCKGFLFPVLIICYFAYASGHRCKTFTLWVLMRGIVSYMQDRRRCPWYPGTFEQISLAVSANFITPYCGKISLMP